MTEPLAAARISRARRAGTVAFGVVVASLLALWIADAVRLALHGLAGVALFNALVVSLPLAIGIGVLCGAVVAAFSVSSWLDAAADERTRWRRLVAYCVEGDAAEHSARIAHVLSVVAATAACGFVAYRATYTLAIDMAQPHFVALAALGVHAAAWLAGATLVIPVRGALRPLIQRGQRLPWVGWPLRSVARVLVGLLLGGVAAATWFAVRSSFALSFLPWEDLARVAGAFVAGTALWFGFAQLSVCMRRGVFALLILMSLSAIGFASRLGDAAQAARIAAEARTLTGAAGYRLLRALIDYDDDGHLHVLGGGDCAPHNPAIHPGATDLPENNIDEDCDGEDLTAHAVDQAAGERFDVPRDWPTRPPIVLITVDAFATTRMAAFGNDKRITPNIDAFAERAVLFRACFAQGPSTRLSIPSMFTSRWDSQIAQRLEGKHPYPIEASELTLAEMLLEAGYDTSAILPNDYFDPGRWKGITDGFRSVDTSSYRPVRSSHNARLVTDLALAELAKPRKRPLFLWVHYYDAHSPHTWPEGAKRGGTTLSDVYDAELRHVDREVGRLLEGLDKNVAAQPLVVLTADHGIDFNSTHHAKFNYGYDLYSSVLHVPLIVRVPGARRARHEHLVSTMDIAPTIANLLRLKRRFPFQGVSLVRELASGYVAESRRLIHQFYIFESYWKGIDPLIKVALRTDRFNLIHDRKQGSYELYDWKADYFEAKDLVGDAEFADVFKDLRKQLAFFTYALHQRPAPIAGEPARRR